MRRHVITSVLGTMAMVAALLAIGQAGAGAAGGRTTTLQLSGSNEFDAAGNPSNPHGNNDRGSVTLTLNQGQERICWTFGAITLTAGEALPSAAHIHEAPAGVAGPVRVNLFGTPDTVPAPTAYPTATTCVHADKALVKAIRKHPERYYVNLHNAQHPGGVMRAQLSA